MLAKEILGNTDPLPFDSLTLKGTLTGAAIVIFVIREPMLATLLISHVMPLRFLGFVWTLHIL